MKREHGSRIEEQDYPYDGNSCSGTDEGWTVEARYVYPSPLVFGEQIFDSRWKSVDFYKSPIGVPSGNENYMNRFAALMGLLPYKSAQALRWWFLAELGRDGISGGLCLETRLVRHEVKYSVSSKAVSAHDNLGGDLAQYSPDRPLDLQGQGRKLA